ncbi:hypothetical protein FOMPIDRAFT_1025470 [Fomitopsis schrenkii]|uniref:Uncharacterized protein n=1 Tax=Fomitopsis schrenkii TaxID=2126942 RepID=S8DUF7_FOMSC|nr:hypothetical protein FOMPIDRAFT_1025470 [Fomitopsis schrenkii]
MAALIDQLASEFKDIIRVGAVVPAGFDAHERARHAIQAAGGVGRTHWGSLGGILVSTMYGALTGFK